MVSVLSGRILLHFIFIVSYNPQKSVDLELLHSTGVDFALQYLPLLLKGLANGNAVALQVFDDQGNALVLVLIHLDL